MFETLVITGLFGVFMLPAPSSSETCIGEFCLTLPSEMKKFDDATSWCQMNNSTLAAINNTGIQMAVTQFLQQLNIESQVFISMKLSQRSGNTWFLVNGFIYSGEVGNQDYNLYKQYIYLKPNMNGDINEFLVEASEPSVLRNYLCEFEGTRCLSNLTSNLLFNNRCYVKYDNASLTWYKARERCIDNGGDIAQFQSGSNPWIPPFSTSWLNSSLTYWAGIRWNDWSWKYSGDTNEIIQTSWSDGKPNNVNYECICVDPKGNPPWTWSDCDCDTPRPFVCLKIVPSTTVSTATSTTTASPTAISATSSLAIPTIAAESNTIHALPNKSEGLIVGLVLGLVVILPLTIFSVILLVWNIRLRRRLRENDRNDERATTTSKTPQGNVDRNAARTNAPDPEINYQHLKRETMFGPGTGISLYDQLSQPENRDYELTQ